MIYKIWIIITAGFIIAGCDESINEISSADQPITVYVRMEVQVLDSLHHIYSRPFTQVYFTTYKLLSDGSQSDFEQSDTTSCPNGWGVKELSFMLNNRDEKIILGAACEYYNGDNYRSEEITYDQADYQADSLGAADIKRTFAIYYK